MLGESAALVVGFAALSWWGLQTDMWLIVAAGAVAQGFWLQRCYCVTHEAAHKKLFPASPRANDVLGQLFGSLILVPLPVFRAIHRFHHGANRRDNYTSALDIFVVPKGAGALRRAAAHLAWYLGVLAGGWYIHSLISVLIFLLIPSHLARRISPAFKGWTLRQQLGSLLIFLSGLGLHTFAWARLGTAAWFAMAGAPTLIFAWVYSAQLYVYHYGTTVGPKTLMHARRLQGGRLLSWWLLNLNEHDTHHRHPKLVWYELPNAGEPLPPEFASNQNVETFAQGLAQQLRGATIVEKAC